MKIFSNIVKHLTKTIGERNEVDDAMAPPLLIQAILGYQILNPKWSWKGTIFEHAFVISLIIYVYIGTIDVLKNSTNDFTTKGEAYYTIVVTSTFIIKYLIFVINRFTFQKVYFIGKTTLYEMIKGISLENSNDMINKMKIIVKLLFASCLCPLVTYLLAAVWTNMVGERVTLSKTTSILMPMISPYYEIGFILHTIFLFYVAFSLCVIDMWFVIVMVFFCEACDCLVILLKVESKRENESDLEYAKRLNDILRMFYKYHDKLMEYLNISSEMYKWPTVIPLIGLLLACCLIGFLMTEKVEWSFLSNFLPIMIQLFAYNWFGEQLKFKAMGLNKALLEFDWTNMRLTDKKNYLIIITYIMKKDFSVRTAFGNDLCLNTMTNLLKASYQAFTLLKTMKE